MEEVHSPSIAVRQDAAMQLLLVENTRLIIHGLLPSRTGRTSEENDQSEVTHTQ
ncbi:MAG: hypothetical protein IPH53_06345 [Flavobacteriales bacterium]|nr:hypothetical protein [Flavobacteriales bacterium]